MKRIDTRPVRVRASHSASSRVRWSLIVGAFLIRRRGWRCGVVGGVGSLWRLLDTLGLQDFLPEIRFLTEQPRAMRGAGGMSSAHLFIFGPIPNPSDWVLASEAPPGFLRLCSLSITPRARGASGSDLVPIDAGLRSQLERLLAAFGRCDEAGRAEVLKLAEAMAGAAP